MMEVRVKAKCPYCGYNIQANYCVSDPDHDGNFQPDNDKVSEPNVGDMIVCTECAEWSRYDKNLVPQKLSSRDYMAFPPHAIDFMNSLKEKVQARQATQLHKWISKK